MSLGQLLFNQTKEMPIPRHHIHLGLLPVSRVVVDDVDALRQLAVPYDIDALDCLITLSKIQKVGCV
jgi:hypothetical protein